MAPINLEPSTEPNLWPLAFWPIVATVSMTALLIGSILFCACCGAGNKGPKFFSTDPTKLDCCRDCIKFALDPKLSQLPRDPNGYDKFGIPYRNDSTTDKMHIFPHGLTTPGNIDAVKKEADPAPDDMAKRKARKSTMPKWTVDVTEPKWTPEKEKTEPESMREKFLVDSFTKDIGKTQPPGPVPEPKSPMEKIKHEIPAIPAAYKKWHEGVGKTQPPGFKQAPGFSPKHFPSTPSPGGLSLKAGFSGIKSLKQTGCTIKGRAAKTDKMMAAKASPAYDMLSGVKIVFTQDKMKAVQGNLAYGTLYGAKSDVFAKTKMKAAKGRPSTAYRAF